MRLRQLFEQTDHFTVDGQEFTLTAQGWVSMGRLYATNSPEGRYLTAVANTVAQNGSTTTQQANKRTGLLDPEGLLAGDLPAYDPKADPYANVGTSDSASRVREPDTANDYKAQVRNPDYYKKWKHSWGKPSRV